MARCDLCVKFDNCPWRSDPDAMCSAFAQKPMTNADCIRNMTDEELANMLMEIAIQGEIPNVGRWNILDWLKEDANE